MNPRKRMIFACFTALAVAYFASAFWDLQKLKVDPWYGFKDVESVRSEVLSSTHGIDTTEDLKGYLVKSGLDCRNLDGDDEVFHCTALASSKKLFADRYWWFEFHTTDGRFSSFLVEETYTGF